MNISIPIAIKIIPPKMSAFESFCPIDFPSRSPIIQIMNVTSAIITEAMKAKKSVKSAIVKPTESASMEVAIP